MSGAAVDESAQAVIEELVRTLGEAAVLGGPGTQRLYRRDASLCGGVEPVAVVFPRTTDDVVAVVRLARRHALAIVPRGSGTGLAGGAVPLVPSIVVVTTRMVEVRAVEPEDGVAWVQPGVLNLDLDRVLAPYGVRFAPDPSSQQACTVGGNVANNSGGPHCLAEGVTSAHVLAVELVTAEGEVTLLGGVDAEPAGYDLRGLVVGSEGTLGVVTAVAVRLSPVAPTVATLLASFDDLDAAAAAVSSVIAAGLVPAALEMIDGPLAAVLEDYVGAGFPREAAAVLLAEVDGTPASTSADASRLVELLDVAGATSVVVAADEAQRAGWWKGRKSAFGAIARIRPDYTLHDTVVPRTRLAAVLREVRSIVEDCDLEVYNDFHAGDGNLHPLVVFDAREPGVMERVHRCGERIVEASLAAGGVLSGEHGIGIEKRELMDRMFDTASLEAQERVRRAFDPDRAMNPDKVLPSGARCGDLGALPEGVWI